MKATNDSIKGATNHSIEKRTKAWEGAHFKKFERSISLVAQNKKRQAFLLSSSFYVFMRDGLRS